MKYLRPIINISKFDIENIVTTSGGTEPELITGKTVEEYAAEMKSTGAVQETIVLTF